jgi:hypothetical protein
VLLGEDPRRQRLWRIAGEHRDNRLRDDRTVVHAGAHEMHGAAVLCHPRGDGAGVGVETRKRRQQRRVDVDDAIVPALDEGGGKNAHEAREADEFDPRLCKLKVNGGLEGGPVGKRSCRDGRCRDARGCGDGKSGRVGPAGDHQRYFRRVIGRLCRRNQGGHVRSAAGNEDCDALPRHHGCPSASTPS